MGWVIKHIEKEMQKRNYSDQTIASYTNAIKEMKESIKKSPKDFTEKDVKSFLSKKLTKGYATATVSQYLNAINFVFTEIYQSPKRFKNLKHPKKNIKVPVVLCESDIKNILDEIPNNRHRLMILLAYSSGLSIGEIISLQVKNISFEDLLLNISAINGGSDRTTILSEEIKEDLQRITKGKQPEDLVFESSRGGLLTRESVQKVFRKAKDRVGIKKDASFHSLRHSFAVNLVQKGTNIRYIQELLGHKDKRTTQIYKKLMAASSCT